MSLPREDDPFDSAGEVKWKPKYVRLTDDAAIVSLCIHDKAYRATYLPWDFDSKGEIRKVCVPIAHYPHHPKRSLVGPVWNDWYIFTGGSNGSGWLLGRHSSTTNRFQGGKYAQRVPTYMNTILSNIANTKDGAEIRDALRFTQSLAAFRAALEDHQSQDPTIAIFKNFYLPLSY
ncbi:hypothetical protein N7527_011654 [Penicillium freii]|nr:hypothetical protein N7527_011654 [Penicillium freii]